MESRAHLWNSICILFNKANKIREQLATQMSQKSLRSVDHGSMVIGVPSGTALHISSIATLLTATQPFVQFHR